MKIKRDSNLVTTLDYFLIGVGILSLPIGLGLVLIGISLFRIGTKWEKIIDEEQRELDEIDAKIAKVESEFSSDEMPILGFIRPDYYNPKTLEEMKWFRFLYS